MRKTTIIPADEAVDLRRGIDHIGVGVAAVVHDGQGRVLLMKRGLKARDEQGRWDICGGAVEFGETIMEAIARELSEELCATSLAVEFLGAYDAHREHAGQPTHWVQMLHAVQVDPKKVKIGEPHKIDAIDWFTSDSLPDPLHSQFWKSFQLALDKGIVK
jgi:8-oxo-dGTP diphosphatase